MFITNQIELHPKLVEKPTIDYCRDNNIAVESWSPLGRGRYLDDPVLEDIALKYGKSPAQIIIKWHLQHDFIVIPKSIHKNRQEENLNVFDFAFDRTDLDTLNQMEDGLRVGSHPDQIK